MPAAFVTSVNSVEVGLAFEFELEGDSFCADLRAVDVVCDELGPGEQNIVRKINNFQMARDFLIWLSVFPPGRHPGCRGLRLF